jgi:hypothetical protein
VHALAAEPGIVGGGDDEAAVEYFLDAGNGAREIGQQCRRALLDDSRGRVCPGDDVALAVRCRCRRDEHRP